jgi:heat shock protein HslJ
MRHLILAAIAAAAVSSLACDHNPFSPSEIVGHTWRLTSVQIPGVEPIILDPDDDYTLRFDEDGTIEVAFDCGDCTGTYILDDEDIQIDDITCDADACGIGAIDPQIAEALESVQNITVDTDDDDLTISGNGVTLRFER